MKSRRHIFRVLFVFTFTVVVGLALSSCGGGGLADSTGTGGTVTSTGTGTTLPTGTATDTGTATSSSTDTATSTSTVISGGPEEEFGTATETTKTIGDMDCKGSSDELVQGGYMKFDLSNVSSTISSASLKVYVKERTGSSIIWGVLISNNPSSAEASVIFNEIEAQEHLVFPGRGIGDGWNTYTLNGTAINAINQAILSSNDDDKWFAMSITFE